MALFWLLNISRYCYSIWTLPNVGNFVFLVNHLDFNLTFIGYKSMWSLLYCWRLPYVPYAYYLLSCWLLSHWTVPNSHIYFFKYTDNLFLLWLQMYIACFAKLFYWILITKIVIMLLIWMYTFYYILTIISILSFQLTNRRSYIIFNVAFSNSLWSHSYLCLRTQTDVWMASHYL